MRTATNRSISHVPVLLTAEQARERLRLHGITITAFAKTHKLPRDVVADVLRGKLQGNYGSSHLAAVALGMKPAPENTANSRTAARGRRS